MPRYIGAYRGGVRPSAPTIVYHTCALSLPCHSEPVTDVTGSGIRSPFHANRRPLAATYLCRFAAKARFDNRPPRGEVSKGEGSRPLPFGRFKDGGFSRGKGNRNPFPLEWRFWLLLSLLTKVTRRRQKKERKAIGRGRTPPLRTSTESPCVIRAGRCGHRPLRKRKMSMRYPCGRAESSAPTHYTPFSAAGCPLVELSTIVHKPVSASSTR